VFQHELPKALAEADGVVMAKVARLELLPEGDRLHPEKVVEDIVAAGRAAYYEPGVDAIIDRLRPLVHEPDVLVIFSNGGFENIHKRLLAEL
jgi:UDP-N-acetylmuramate: L-alanyl-gamma-D-glutamyl-meso-diaminopimelate ligase